MCDLADMPTRVLSITQMCGSVETVLPPATAALESELIMQPIFNVSQEPHWVQPRSELDNIITASTSTRNSSEAKVPSSDNRAGSDSQILSCLGEVVPGAGFAGVIRKAGREGMGESFPNLPSHVS